MIKNNLGSTAVPGYNEASGIPKLIIRNNLRATHYCQEADSEPPSRHAEATEDL